MVKTRTKRRDQKVRAGESKTVMLATVCWLLSMITTLILELTSAIAVLLAAPDSRLELLGRYLLFAALVIGTLSLVLMLVVVKIRPQRPPLGILVFSTLAACAPWLVGIVLELR